MNRPRKHSDLKLAMGLLAPSMLLLAVLVLIQCFQYSDQFFDMPLNLTQTPFYRIKQLS